MKDSVTSDLKSQNTVSACSSHFIYSWIYVFRHLEPNRHDRETFYSRATEPERWEQYEAKADYSFFEDLNTDSEWLHFLLTGEDPSEDKSISTFLRER